MKPWSNPLRQPAFAGLTAAVLIAVGLWTAAVVLLLASRAELAGADAAALLVALAWAALGVRLGSRAGQNQRRHRHHLVANLLGCTLLLGVYQLMQLLAGG